MRPGLHGQGYMIRDYAKRYNTRVPRLENRSADSVNLTDPHQTDLQEEDSHPSRRHAHYTSETVGLLLIAALLLALTLIRYWHYIHWSLR
jgi:hypothetical protein